MQWTAKTSLKLVNSVDYGNLVDAADYENLVYMVDSKN